MDLTEYPEGWSCHQLGLERQQMEQVWRQRLGVPFGTQSLRCVLDIQVKRSFIAAGYMSLEFKRGIQAGAINLEVFSLKLNF